MIDPTTFIEPCPTCSELQIHVNQINKALQDQYEFSTKITLLGSNVEQDSIEISAIQLQCARCRGRGQLLSSEGRRVIEILKACLLMSEDATPSKRHTTTPE